MITNAGGNYEVASVQYDWKIMDNIAFCLIPSMQFFSKCNESTPQEEVVHGTTQHVVKGSCNVWGRGELKFLCNIKQETETSLKLHTVSNNTQKRTRRNLLGQLNWLCTVYLRSVKILRTRLTVTRLTG